MTWPARLAAGVLRLVATLVVCVALAAGVAIVAGVIFYLLAG